MKCGTLIKRELKGKKNPKLKITRMVLPHLQANWHESFEGYELCDGEIVASVDSVSDGGSCCCCCSSSEVEVTFECNKCGVRGWSELSMDAKGLSELVTRAIAAMTDEERSKKLEAIREQEAQWQRNLEQMRREQAVRDENARRKRAEKKAAKATKG